MSFTMTIAWGDCDSAGIVYYPNYFRWFDNAFHHLLSTRGHDQRSLMKRYGIVGTPLADTGARFMRPATYGDDISIDSQVSEWKDKMFRVEHTVSRTGETIAEGHELRFWGVRDDATGKIAAAPIDREFKALLTG